MDSNRVASEYREKIKAMDSSMEDKPGALYPHPPNTDPWKHRSKTMKCMTCMWFVLKELTTAIYPAQDRLGRCRRHAPTMNGYPAIFETDWCGDHKMDETKI